MNKIFFLLCIVLMSSTVFAQIENSKPQKIDEFGVLSCDDMMSRADNFRNALKSEPSARGFIVYYEGRHLGLNPRIGEAKNRVDEIILYLTKQNRGSPLGIITIDAGFREKFTVEFWLVPNGSDEPKLAPTIQKENIRFRKGKAMKVRDCACFC
jgi:hypothetical protein